MEVTMICFLQVNIHSDRLIKALLNSASNSSMHSIIPPNFALGTSGMAPPSANGSVQWAVCCMVLLIAVAFAGAAPCGLHPSFYDSKCPHLQKLVQGKVREAMQRDGRMPASLLRLHFHDCFVNGCDGSILLDDGPNFVGEKTAAPNLNSVRGFEVIDEIKREVEALCPETVSCADILAIVARDSVALSGGPSWEVKLGRRDSLGASKTAVANSIPKATFNFAQLVASFNKVGLNERDVVALSGSHTIGMARCTSFQARLNAHQANAQFPGPGPFLESKYLVKLRALCPANGDGNTTTHLDPLSPPDFDNQYFKNVQAAKGLLNSDAVLQTTNGPSKQLVATYANNEHAFFKDFARSMLKMGSIGVVTGNEGEVRRNCRLPNRRFT